MEKAFKPGLMVQNIKVNMYKVKNKERDILNGEINLHIKVNSSKIIFMDMELIIGQIIENILDFGLKIKCKVKAHLPGLMEESMKVII